MDATRMSDGKIVTIKRVKKSTNPWEESIIHLFSTEPLASDPHNYTIPVYDLLQSPLDHNSTLLVMPYLVRIQNYRFATVGEAMECFRQLFEVSPLFVHQCVRNLTHRLNLRGYSSYTVT